MRLIVLLCAAIALCGCNSTRTVPPEEKRSAIASAKGEQSRRAALALIESPIYTASLGTVFKASIRACQDYFHHVDQFDRTKYSIFIDNSNAWAGDTSVHIQLLTNGTGQVMVAAESHAVGLNQPMWDRPRRDIEQFIKYLTLEMTITQ